MIEKLPAFNYSGDSLLINSSDLDGFLESLDDLLEPDGLATQADSENPTIQDVNEVVTQEEQGIRMAEAEQTAPLDLHQAYIGELSKALEKLKEDKENFDVNSQDHDGDTTLNICAILLWRHFKTEGFNFSQQRSEAVNLLINISRQLLKRKADVNIVNNKGEAFFDILVRSYYVSVDHPHVNITAVIQSILTDSFIRAHDTDISPILYALGKVLKKDKDGLMSDDGRTRVFELAFRNIVNRITGLANKGHCQYNEFFVYEGETQTLEQVYTEIGYGAWLPAQKSPVSQEPWVTSLFFPSAGIKRRRTNDEIRENPKKVREVSLSP